MRTLIILISAIALLSTSCTDKCLNPTYDESGNFLQMVEVDCNTVDEQFSETGCETNFMLGQPASGAVRTIQVDSQGYPNDGGNCVFDISIYEAGLPATPTNIVWTVNDENVALGQSNLTIEVPAEYTLVCVSYIIGTQTGTDCRSFTP